MAGDTSVNPNLYTSVPPVIEELKNEETTHMETDSTRMLDPTFEDGKITKEEILEQQKKQVERLQSLQTI